MRDYGERFVQSEVKSVQSTRSPGSFPDGSKGRPPEGLADADIRSLVAERARFQRFVAARVGNNADAEDILQNSLLRALGGGAGLRRSEKVVAWFYRILRHAIADHYRQKKSTEVRMEKLWSSLQAAGNDRVDPPADWNTAICVCFHGLLPTLKPRYAELLRRIDLRGESRETAAKDLKITRATLDVVLHRARVALRERLEIFCGACSQEKCVECFCLQKKV